MKKCCFDGYTPFELSYNDIDYVKLKCVITEVVLKLIQEEYYYYLCGFDQGADICFAESVVELKKKYHGIYLQSVIPYEDQASDWSESDREQYFDLLSYCDKETLLYTHFQKGCLSERNKYLVSNSDILIATYDGRLSLTMQTIVYAKKLCKDIILINPYTYNITMVLCAFVRSSPI
jgi:Uncharacterized protein conserved in bacteria